MTHFTTIKCVWLIKRFEFAFMHVLHTKQKQVKAQLSLVLQSSPLWAWGAGTVSEWHIQGSQVTLHSIVSLSVSSTRWLMFSDSSLLRRTSPAQVGLSPACIFLYILLHCVKYVALHAADSVSYAVEWPLQISSSYDTWRQDVIVIVNARLFVCFIIHVLNIHFGILCPVHYIYLCIIFIHVNNVNFLPRVKKNRATCKFMWHLVCIQIWVFLNSKLTLLCNKPFITFYIFYFCNPTPSLSSCVPPLF